MFSALFEERGIRIRAALSSDKVFSLCGYSLCMRNERGHAVLRYYYSRLSTLSLGRKSLFYYFSSKFLIERARAKFILLTREREIRIPRVYLSLSMTSACIKDDALERIDRTCWRANDRTIYERKIRPDKYICATRDRFQYGKKICSR